MLYNEWAELGTLPWFTTDHNEMGCIAIAQLQALLQNAVDDFDHVDMSGQVGNEDGAFNRVFPVMNEAFNAEAPPNDTPSRRKPRIRMRS